MALKVYGIKNCNTVKSALLWLKDRNIEFEFHDFKAKGVTKEKLAAWSGQVGWETLVNRRGTTWRQLGPEIQEKITGKTAAIDLMSDKTSVIKRPVIEENGTIITVGFDAGQFEENYG